MLMLFRWWFEQEFVQTVATCNYLEDAISIEYDVIIDKSSVTTVLSNMSCIVSLDGECPIIY